MLEKSIGDSLCLVLNSVPDDRIALQVIPAPEIGSAGEKITYKDLRDRISRQAEDFLSKGLKGKRVGIRMERNPSTIIAVLAALASGNSAVFLNPEEGKEKTGEKIERTDCALLIGEKGQEMIRNTQVSGTDEAFLLFTSGTTGKEKCVIRTQENVLSAAEFNVRSLHYGRMQLLNLPLYHCAAWERIIVPSLLTGYTVTLSRGPGNWTEEIQRTRPEELFVVPAQAALLLDLMEGEDAGAFSSIRFIISTGAALNSAIKEKCASMHVECLDIYGSSEGGCITNPVYTDGRYETRQGSVGKLMPDSVCRINAPDSDGYGELLLKGPSVFPGYLDDEEATGEALADGWLHTGDLAKKDADGFLYLNGRIRNRIILDSGENISPEELEEIFGKIEGIRECLCFEYRDAVTMEIVLDHEWSAAHPVFDQEIFLQEKTDEINGKLPSWKRVSAFYLRDKPLERTSAGKLRRAGIPSPEEDGCVLLKGADDRYPHGKDPGPEEALLLAFRHAFPGKKIGVEDNFFDLGGDSLTAMRVTVALAETGYSVRARDIFEFPDIMKLQAALAKRGGKSVPEDLPEVPEEVLKEIPEDCVKNTEAVYPLFPLQQDYMRLKPQYRTVSGSFFTDRLFVLKRPLSEHMFYERAASLVKKHPALRTVCFCDVNGTIYERTGKEGLITSEYSDLREMSGSDSEKMDLILNSWRERLKERADQKFPDRVGFFYYRISDQKSVLLMEMLHMAMDRWSAEILARELIDGRSFAEDEFHNARNSYLIRRTAEKETGKEFWTGFLKEAGMGTDEHGEPSVREQKVLPLEYSGFSLGEEEIMRIREHSRRLRLSSAELTSYLYMQALLEAEEMDQLIYFERFSGREDLAFDMEGTVGYFANTAPCFIRRSDSAAAYHERLSRISKYSMLLPEEIRTRLSGIPYGLNQMDFGLPPLENAVSGTFLKPGKGIMIGSPGIRDSALEPAGKRRSFTIIYTGGAGIREKAEMIRMLFIDKVLNI